MLLDLKALGAASLPSVTPISVPTVSRFDVRAGRDRSLFPGVDPVKQAFPCHPENEFTVSFYGVGTQ